MNHIPPSTIVIALAMLAFSVVIVSKMGGKIMLAPRVKALLVGLGGVCLCLGLYLHLNQTPAARPLAARVAGQQKPPEEPFTFTFSPGQTRWGEQVEIRVPFPAESVTVYLNGMPLPKKVVAGGQTMHVTIPSGAKSGYLELERDGARARASEQIIIAH
jgi:hypothetical protein